MWTFVKAQFSSLSATVMDFSITIFFTGVMGYWYVFSSGMGNLMGGITNFYLGRVWVFQSRGKSPLYQGWKYLIIWQGSLLLNVTGVFFATDVLKFPYLISKIIVSVAVGIFFNFNLQKTFVFKT